MSVASNLEGTAIISGHLDGTIYRFYFDDNASGASQGKFVKHRVPPICLSWNESIVVAGSDQIVSFYDIKGNYYHLISQEM